MLLSRKGRRLGGAAAVVLGLVVAAPPSIALAGQVPNQFLAKLYTEGLGRTRDGGGWASMSASFNASGCTLAAIRSNAKDIFTSGEYVGLGYTDQEKVLTTFRAVLNRDPDPGGLSTWTGYLGSHTISELIDQLTASPEFTALQPQICSTTNAGYGFGTFAPPALTVSGTGFSGTEAALQTLLNGTPSGGTVSLAQHAIINLTTTLNIPAGVTLTTTGSPSVYQYAKHARLVRGFSGTSAAAVQLQGGAKLKSVWVDGQRSVAGTFSTYDINIAMLGGTGTEVSRVKSSNTQGWTNIAASGSEGRVGNLGYHPCTGNVIHENTVTGYQASHSDGTWSDGISVGCEDATIDMNGVVDPTDVGIILFEADTATQHSTATGNYVVSAGLSAFGGLAMDPLIFGGSYSFAGAAISANHLWTGTATHFNIGLAVGTRAWFGGIAGVGNGGSFTNNDTGSNTARVNTGIGVNGMLGVTVTGNATSGFGLVSTSSCPHVAIAAAVTAGHASGTIQGPYTDTAFDNCITPDQP